MLHTSDLWNCRVKNELLILKNCFLNSYIENCKQGVPKCEELLQKKPPFTGNALNQNKKISYYVLN